MSARIIPFPVPPPRAPRVTINSWDKEEMGLQVMGSDMVGTLWSKNDARIALVPLGDANAPWGLYYYPQGLDGPVEASEAGEEDVLFELSKDWRQKW